MQESNGEIKILKPSIKQFFIDTYFRIILFVPVLIASILDIPYRFIYVIIAFILFISLFYTLLFLLSISWTVEHEQIKYKRGIIANTTDYIELYRIYDYKEKQQFLEALIGIKTILIYSTDKNNPVLSMFGIHKQNRIIMLIRDRVELLKYKKNIYEIANK